MFATSPVKRLGKFADVRPSAPGNLAPAVTAVQRRLRLSVLLLALLWAGGLAGQSTEAPVTPNAQNAASSQGASSIPGEQAQMFTLEGKVKSGNTLIPGATVTATNAATQAKAVGWSRTDGSYSVMLLAAGDYEVRVQMVGFAVATQHVNVGVSAPHPQVSFQMTLLSRAQNAAGAAYAHGGAGGNRGFQALAVVAAEANNNASGAGSTDSVAPAGMPVPGIPPSIATESVAVSGSSSGNVFDMSSDEMRSRMQDYRNQQGGMGGPGGMGLGGPGGGQGGGGFGPPGGGGPFTLRTRGFNFNQPHGTVYYSANTSGLDATPYSLTGEPSPKPEFLQQRFGASIGGPLNIPHIYHVGP